MNKLTLLIAAIFLTVAVFAGNPVLKKVEVNPTKVKVGQEVTFILTFSGKKESIKSIKLFNQEFPDNAPVIELQADPGSKQNIWKAVGPVPETAPPGIYNWEIKAIDSKDKEIVDKKYNSQSYGKTGKLTFEIVI